MLFFFPILIIPIILIGLYYYSKGRREASRAESEQAGLTLADLRGESRIPESKLSGGITSGTIYGNKWVAWFEALLRETFATREDFEENLRFLDGQYVRLLQLLKEYIEKVWEPAWQGDYDATQPKALRGDWGLHLLEQSLRWLKKIAEEQWQLLVACGDTSPRWNAEIFETTSTRVVQNVGLTQYDVVTIRANPRVLEEEIRRLAKTGVPITALPAGIAASAEVVAAPPVAIAAQPLPIAAPSKIGAKEKLAKKRTPLDWGLPVGLSLLAVPVTLANVMGLTGGWGLLTNIVVFLIAAGVIGSQVEQRRFAHGFATGAWLAVVGALVLLPLFPIAAAHHPEWQVAKAGQPAPSPRVLMLITLPIWAAFQGLILGLLAWAAGKILPSGRKPSGRKQTGSASQFAPHSHR